MRSALAVLTAVAFLANAPLANAAAASPTTAVAGYCLWSTEPALLDLGDIVGDADCASAEAVVLDPHVVTNVVVLPEYTGPRAMGEPSGERTIADVRWSDPYVTTDAPGERILLLDAYDSYKDGLATWRAATQVASEAAGSAHAEWFSVGPTWMRNVNGTTTATAGILAGDFASNAAATALFPLIGVAAFLPAVESFAGEVRDAPAHVGSGASEAWTGAKAGRFDQFAEGVAEVCGGVGVLASVAVPFAKGAGAISVRTTPVTLFPKGVPVVKPVSAPVIANIRAIPPEAPFILPQSLGAAGKAIQVRSRIGHTNLSRSLAESLGELAQRDVDTLVQKLKDGHTDAGLGSRSLGDNFFELRGDNAGRVIVKRRSLSEYDIVGKLQAHQGGDKIYSQRIKNLIKNYKELDLEHAP